LENENLPYVSIITVNFNGKTFLKDLLRSLLDLDYPRHKVEIIMVDNASSDGSADYVREEFRKVRVISSKKNRGYAGGNNLGIEKASHPLIALVNNDMVVDRGWLLGLVHTLKKREASAAGSKVLFFFKYLPLMISSEGPVTIGHLCIKGQGAHRDKLSFANKSIKVKGARPEKDENGKLFYTLEKKALIYVPLVGDSAQSFSFKMSGDAEISVSDAHLSAQVHRSKNELILKTGPGQVPGSLYLINSAGIEINRTFYSRDRGSGEEQGSYPDTEELFGLSGSSLLIDRKLFEDTGLFDESFFTYYEDIDLFYRARLKGHRMYYSPASIAYHYHCGSGNEWSYSFTYHVLRNRLLMLYKNSPFSTFAPNYARFCASALYGVLAWLKGALKGRMPNRPDIRIRVRLFFELPFYLLLKTAQRFRTRSGIKIDERTIAKWFKEF
jgi:GT2 family glycosyltransferase